MPGIENMLDLPFSAKWKKLWDRSVAVVLSILVVAFVWIVISNMYLLYMGKPLIKTH